MEILPLGASTLSAAQLSAYRDNGFTCSRNLFDVQQLAALTAAADEAAARVQAEPPGKTYFLDGNRFVDYGHVTVQFEHQPGSNNVRVIEPINDWVGVFDELLDYPELVLPMQQLVGKRQLALWTCKLNFKGAGGSGFGFHQDSPYWLQAQDRLHALPNVMIALDAANSGNGCLQVVPGSHKAGLLPGCDDGRQLGGLFTDPTSFAAHRATSVPLQAGDALWFDPHLVHGSQPNISDRPRRALIVTYQAAGHAALKSGQQRRIKT